MWSTELRPRPACVSTCSVRRLLLRAPEMLCQRRRPVARAVLARGDRADRDRSQPRPLDSAQPRSVDRGRRTPASTRPTTRPPSPRSSCSIISSNGCSATAGSSSRRGGATVGRNLYGWAEAHPHATPFVADAVVRSHVTATIDFDDTVDAAAVAATLRANGCSTSNRIESSAVISCASQCSRRSIRTSRFARPRDRLHHRDLEHRLQKLM